MMIELPDARKVGEIAADFDGLTWMHTSDPNEGERDHDGYNILTGVMLDRAKGTAQLTLERGEAE